MATLFILIHLSHICYSQTVVFQTWDDDFKVSGEDAWSDNRIYNDNCGPASQYHGVYNWAALIILERTFVCDDLYDRYWVSIDYGIAYDPCGDPNTVEVLINTETVATHKRDDGTGYNITDKCYSSIGCSGNMNAHIQERSISPTSLNDISPTDAFLLTFSLDIIDGYELAMFGIRINCHPKTQLPTYIPTLHPSNIPTKYPSYLPTNQPTFVPIYKPTVMPTPMPFYTPTSNPTIIPTTIPSYPTNIPTVNPPQSANEGGVGGSTEVTLDNTQDAFVEDSTFGDQGYPKEVYIVMLIIIFLLVICMLLLCCIYCKKRKQYDEKQRTAMIGNSKSVQLANVISTSQDMDIMMPAMSTSMTNVSIYNNSNIAMNSEIDAYSDCIALQMWLKNIDCMEYYDIFIKQGFGNRMSILYTLNDNDLQEMGITKFAHRKRILAQVGMNNANMMSGSMNIGLMGIGPASEVMNQTNGMSVIMANEQGDSDSDQELYFKPGNNDIVNNVTTMGILTRNIQSQGNVVNNEDINEEHTEGSEELENKLDANIETEQ